MTIAEWREKSKSVLGRIPRDVLIIAILILASSASFGMGYLARQGAGQGGDAVVEDLSPLATSSASGEVVASKNGTKYYLPSCSGADRISLANKVWFVSASDAERAGYAPATNCKGL
ncbi:MAG: hypothetical protein ACYCZZ_00850 [Minisyncoccota bacterium]